MTTSGPAVAVINLPGVSRALVNAGFNVVGDGLSDTKATIDLVRDMNRDKAQIVVIIAIDDPSLRMWATLQAAMDVPVLVAYSDIFNSGNGIPKSRQIELPCSVNTLMGVFGAPPSAELEVEIGVDGRAAAVDDVPDDRFEVFAAPSKAGRTSSEDDDFSLGCTGHRHAPHADDSSPPPGENIFAPSPTSEFEAPISQAPTESVFATSERTADEDTTSVFAPRDDASTSIFESISDEPVVVPEEIPIRPAVAPVDESTHVRERPRHDITANEIFTHAQSTTRTRERLGEVVVVWAGKGGATKSTTTGALAERGAVMVPGLRDVVVDLSRGQGAQRSLLRLNDVDVPSMYDAAVSNSPDVFRDVLINPKRLTTLRGGRSPLHFGVILAPPKDQADHQIVTSRAYADAIEYARRQADLVFIDTQTIEAQDTTGLIDDVVVPLLLSGAWGLGLSDSSTEGVENLEWILQNFVGRGVSSSRLMVAFNRVNPTSVLNPEAITARFSSYATWMGAVMIDPAIEAAHGSGEIPGSTNTDATPEYTALLDRVLYRVTGIASFASKPYETPHKNTSISKRRFGKRR